jgi:A/G-specific adenine glycosylase
VAEFARRLIRWQRRHGRRDLPWQRHPAPYRTWVSEIMLQQTQVAAVIPYFERFMECFPDVRSLASAPLDDVLHLWSGLGYYARARNLHRAAALVVREHGGELPLDVDALVRLPGIGRSTAGAIVSLSTGRPSAVLDGNVRRVLIRLHALRGRPDHAAVVEELWRLAEAHLPSRNGNTYTQAVMDLGATICARNRPRCASCPVEDLCAARRQGIETLLPERRNAARRPVREATLVLVENPAGGILLERRPPAGIWGGLWSLPECPPGLDVVDWVRSRFGWRVARAAPASAIRHTFTHFHLDIRPVHVMLADDCGGVGDADGIAWHAPGETRGRGVAAPIRRLLDSLRAEPAGG